MLTMPIFGAGCCALAAEATHSRAAAGIKILLITIYFLILP
jgi:hypothetical protein